MEIYHNPRCSKSRQALTLLEENGINPVIKLYLQDLPSKAELKEVLSKLGLKAEELIRKNENDFKENFKGKNLTEDEWMDAMLAYPKLIERPIFIKGDKAIVGRPHEKVLELI